MQLTVKKIIMIRLHSNMAKAISTQPIVIYSFGFDDFINYAISASFPSNIIIIPEDIREPKTLFDDVHHAKALIKAIRAEKPDVIHVNALQDLPFTLVVVHLFRRSRGRPKVVVMSHNPHTWESPRKAWLASTLIRLFTDGYISSSTANKNKLLRLNFPKNKITFIPNPYDLDQARIEAKENRSFQMPRKTLRIIYTANICERKAQDVLVDAAELVLKKHPNVYFELIGRVISGQEEYAQKVSRLIQKAEIEKNVHMIGALPYRDVISKLVDCDIFVFPSRAEVMPRALIEAMLAGKPVVASGVDGILDLIENKKTGILVHPGNVDELAGAICELIDAPALAEGLGLAGKEYVRDYCSPERVGRLFREFYNQTLQASS
jgi:glycosyltransferase involved in cell wall biosynthesis